MPRNSLFSPSKSLKWAMIASIQLAHIFIFIIITQQSATIFRSHVAYPFTYKMIRQFTYFVTFFMNTLRLDDLLLYIVFIVLFYVLLHIGKLL
jgi:TctA family transporter